MRAALYIRVSTEEQAIHGESVADQEQALVAWAEKNGHQVEGIFRDEGYSAHKKYTTRPALRRLLYDIRDDKVDVVAFTKLDRWSRRAGDYYALQDILDAHHVGWVAILEDYDTLTSDGRLKVGIMLSVNQHEAERTSDRLKFTFAQKRERGELCSGKLPRGYVAVNKKPVIDEDEQPRMRAFFDAFLRTGSLFKAMEAYGKPISRETAAFICRNAMNYTGLVQNVPCEPYITVAQAEQILATRGTKAKRTDLVYLFSGMIFCAECGGRFSGHQARSDIAYHCRNREHYRPRPCDNQVYIRQKDVEAACIEAIDAVMSKASLPQEEPEDFTQEIVSLKERRQRALSVYLDGIISKEEFEAERKRIDARLNEIEKPPAKRTLPVLPGGWREMYSELTDENKKAFWLSVHPKILIHKDRSVQLLIE